MRLQESLADWPLRFPPRILSWHPAYQRVPQPPSLPEGHRAMHARRQLVWLAISLFLPTSASAQSTAPLLLREPGLSATEICFSYGGDLWTVPRTGGTAHRLTASPVRPR